MASVLILLVVVGSSYAQESASKEKYSAGMSLAEVRANPDSAEAHYKLGCAYFKNHILFGKGNDLNNAEIEFKKAISIKPDYAEAYNALGWVYQTANKVFLCATMEFKLYSREIAERQTKYILAEENHLQAIHLKPDYADAYRGLSRAYFHMERYAEAADAFNQAIRLYPDPELIQLDRDYDLVYFTMGIAYRKLKWFDEAVAAYEKVVERNLDFDNYPDEDRRFWKRGVLEESFSIIASIYTESSRHLEAVATYKRMLGAFPNDWGAKWEVNYDLCIAYKALGDMKSAKATYEVLVKQVQAMESERFKTAFGEQLDWLREKLNK